MILWNRKVLKPKLLISSYMSKERCWQLNQRRNGDTPVRWKGTCKPKDRKEHRWPPEDYSESKNSGTNTESTCSPESHVRCIFRSWEEWQRRYGSGTQAVLGASCCDRHLLDDSRVRSPLVLQCGFEVIPRSSAQNLCFQPCQWDCELPTSSNKPCV